MASDSNDHTKRENVPRDEDSGLSMVDVLEEEKQLEEDAKAVLGDSDDKNCTYPMGYIPRQALYSCTTCVPPPDSPAGICLACSYECHEGHELVELYTKRNFKCDCGNIKFKDLTCKLCPTKMPQNSDNQYNQNFAGKYCTCHRPYPDPDDSIEDEMIQCVVCEDWYHGRHLDGKLPDNNDYDEMICQGCMKKNEYLWAYNACSEVITLKKEETTTEIDVESSNRAENQLADDTGSKAGPATTAAEKTEADVIKSGGNDKNAEDSNTPGPSNCKVVDSANAGGSTCLLVELEKRQKRPAHGAALWHTGWRKKLCKCTSCKARYEAAAVAFLLETEDTVHAYEERGKQKHGTGSDYDQGMQALSNMNRVQQVEVIHGYNNLKHELKDYLKKFAENGKMVKEEDIREFFSGMEARKRQRVGGMQWTCK